MAVAAVLLLGAGPALAVERMVVRVGGLELLLELSQLEDWLRNPSGRSELEPWFNLLDPATRWDLATLLRRPFPVRGDQAAPLLDSWAGRQLLQQLGQVLRPAQGEAAPLLLDLFRRADGRQTPTQLLRQSPGTSLLLDLDALLDLGAQLQRQLIAQRGLVQQLQALDLPPLPPLPPARQGVMRQDERLVVAHRSQPLPLALVWPATGPLRSRWVLLSHGLGGSREQLLWLAEGLAARGWPVVVTQHPGSDDAAVRDLLAGQRSLPGVETLPDRLQDLQAVTRAVADRRLQFGLRTTPPVVVLSGHSLGGLADLLWAGARPSRDLATRCQQALTAIPVLNSSLLLQCQLASTELPALDPPLDLSGIVTLNGFGSLVWGSDGLGRMNQPVLLVGGSLDLITPPLAEQIGPFRQLKDPRSRLVLVEGASHFSPVRLERERPLLQLGDDLVGKDPRQVQELLLEVHSLFLQGLEPGATAPVGVLRQGNVRAWLLDRAGAARLRLRK
jgi:predicted dienelactone hydrolase